MQKKKMERNPKPSDVILQRPLSMDWTTLRLGFVLDYCQENVGEVFCLPDKGCFIPVLIELPSRGGFVGST